MECCRAHDFQGISNICALYGLSLAPEIISSFWDYTLNLDQDAELFSQSSTNSVSQVAKLRKEIQICRCEGTWGEKHFLHSEVLTVQSEYRQQVVCFC